MKTKKKILRTNMEKSRIRLDCNEHIVEVQVYPTGVSLWVDNRWVIDASLFTKSMEFTIGSKMKEVESDGNNKRFRMK